MNNLQLATLLSSYHNHLSAIRDGISSNLSENEYIEREIIKKRGKWIGKGRKFTILDSLIQNDNDWEWLEEEGDPACLSELKEFIDDLEFAIDNLKEGENE